MTSPDIRQLIAVALSVVNTLGVENATVGLKSDAQGVRVEIEFRDVTLRAGRLDGVAIDEGLIRIEGLDPAAGPRAMVKFSPIRVERLLIRVSASLVNRLLESDFVKAEIRRRAPAEVRNLELLFNGERLTLRGQVRKGLTFPFEVQLGLKAVNNRLRVAFKEFWAAEMVPMPGFLRRLLMSMARSQVNGRPELRGLVRIEEDFVEINPWPKVPFPVDAEFTRFGIEGHYLVIEMGPSAPSAPGTQPEQPATRGGVQTLPSPSPAPVPIPQPLPPPIPASAGTPVPRPGTPGSPAPTRRSLP